MNKSRTLAAKVRHGNPDALRKFILTVRGNVDHVSAFRKLKLKRTTFYRLLSLVREAGHTV
jgi:hypothetical protein